MGDRMDDSPKEYAKELKGENPHIIMQEIEGERSGYSVLGVEETKTEAVEKAEEIAKNQSEPGLFPAKDPSTGEYVDYKKPDILVMKPVLKVETETVTKEMQKEHFSSD